MHQKRESDFMYRHGRRETSNEYVYVYEYERGRGRGRGGGGGGGEARQSEMAFFIENM